MQNVERVRECLKLAAREAKANRVASMTLVQQTLYVLLVAGKQARDRRQYALALDYTLAHRILKLTGSIADAWRALQEESEPASEIGQLTPASNTGVTEPSASVPIEYFTGGK